MNSLRLMSDSTEVRAGSLPSLTPTAASPIPTDVASLKAAAACKIQVGQRPGDLLALIAHKAHLAPGGLS